MMRDSMITLGLARFVHETNLGTKRTWKTTTKR